VIGVTIADTPIIGFLTDLDRFPQIAGISEGLWGLPIHLSLNNSIIS
jgi:hypothetical protein